MAVIHRGLALNKRSLTPEKEGRISLMRVSLVTRLSAVCVPVAALTASANASANYYALLSSNTISNGDADDGMFTNIQTNILHATCNIFVHDFVDHEMWYATDMNQHWVEVGFTDGSSYGGACESDQAFWADSRPGGGGYHEHYYSITVDWNNWEALQITADGSCQWDVQAGGWDLGISTWNCPGSARGLTAGIEITSQSSGSVKGFLVGWWEQNGSGQWNPNWDGQSMFSWNPPYMQQVGSQLETEEVLNESF